MSETLDVSAIASRIKHYVDSTSLELIWADTNEQLVQELLDAGVVWKSHPHRRISFGKAFVAVSEAILRICKEGYVFVNMPGTTMLGYRPEHWPNEPWSLPCDDLAPVFPDRFLQHLPVRQAILLESY